MFQMFITSPGIKFQKHIMNPVLVVEFRQEIRVYDLYDEDYFKNVFDDPYEKVIDSHIIAAVSFGCENPGIQFKGKYHIILTDDDISRSLHYLYKKVSKEVIRFNKPEFCEEDCCGV